MRKNLLIASLIVLILGFVISGPVGIILLTVGILILIYVIFSKERAIEHPESARYVRKDIKEDTTHRYDRDPKKLYDTDTEHRKKSKERIERELRAWDSGKKARKCPKCGSTSNPDNAQYCADCGTKL